MTVWYCGSIVFIMSQSLLLADVDSPKDSQEHLGKYNLPDTVTDKQAEAGKR